MGDPGAHDGSDRTGDGEKAAGSRVVPLSH